MRVRPTPDGVQVSVISSRKTRRGVPTTPDPNTSAKVSRYKWEAHRDTNWWCIYYPPPGENYKNNSPRIFLCDFFLGGGGRLQ